MVRELAAAAMQTPFTFGDMLHRLGDRTYGLLLVILASINIVPLLSMVAGPVIAGLGLQMALGISRPWFPRKLCALELPSPGTAEALLKAVPTITRLERFILPRWHFTEAPIVDRSLGLVVMALGMIITIPAPFTNLPPSVVLVLLGLGLVERDGRVQLLGLLLGLLTVGLLWTLLRAWF